MHDFRGMLQLSPVSLLLVVVDFAAGGAISNVVDRPLKAVLPAAAGQFLTVLILAIVAYGLVGWILVVVADTVSAENHIPETILRWDELVSSATTAWTIWYFLPMCLLLLLALPGSLGGQIPSALWPCVLLLVWSLPGNPVSQPGRFRQASLPDQAPDVEATGPEHEEAADILEYLRRSPGYHGQITVVKERKKGDPPLWDPRFGEPEYYAEDVAIYGEGSPAHFALPLGEGQNRLYKHQGRLVQMLNQHRAAALATGVGSGRMSILLPIILDTVLSRGSTVLVLAPDDASCEAGYEHLERTMTQSRWQWSVVMAMCKDVTDDVDKVAEANPQIVFATFEVAHRRLLPDATGRWATFFSGIDLIVVLRTERLAGIFGANCAMVLRRLMRVCRAHGAEPQLLSLIRPVANAHLFLTSLFGEDFKPESIVAQDSAPMDAQTVVFWNSAGVADNDLKLARSDYAEESRSLAVQLTNAGRKAVVFAGAVPLTAGDVGAIRQALPQVPVVQDMSDREFGRNYHSFDAVVMTGAPGPFTLVNHDLAHLSGGSSGHALICIVPPHQPLAQYFVRRPDLFFGSTTLPDVDLELTNELPEVALTLTNQYVVRKHMLAAAAEMTLGEADVEKYFGPTGKSLIDHLLNEHEVEEVESQRAEDRRLVTTTGYRAVDRRAPTWHLDTATSDIVWLVNAFTQAPMRQIDASTADIVAYQGAVMVLGDARYRVDRRAGDLEGGTIMLDPNVSSLGSSSIRNLVLRPVDSIAVRRQPTRINNGLQYTVRIGPIDIDATVTGVHHYDGSALNGRMQFETKAGNAVLTSQIGTQGILVSFEEGELGPNIERAVHTLAHLGQIVMPLLLTCGPDDVGVGYVGHVQTAEGPLSMPALLFFDAVPGGSGAMNVLDGKLASFFKVAYDILASCACTDGCPACIQIVQCHSVTPNTDLDKRAAKELLAHVLNLAKLPAADADLTKHETLQVIRNIIQEQLRNRLGMQIKDLAPVRFFDQTESARHIDGLFYHSPLQVSVRSRPYSRTMAVLAHEYAHNWQAEPGNMNPCLRAASVPFDGRLFVEGFALWVEYKLHDIFGYDDNAQRLTFTSFDQYSEGFLIFRQLEDEGGVKRVFEFLSHPDEPATWPKLYARAGIADRALNRWKELKDAGKDLPQDDWEGMTTFDDGPPSH